MALAFVIALTSRVMSNIHITHARIITSERPTFCVKLNIYVEAQHLEQARMVVAERFQADRVYFTYEEI